MITGTMTGTTSSQTIQISGIAALSVDLGGGVNVVDLERQVDGTNWRVVESYDADTEKNIEGANQLYRLTCSTYASGTITYAIG